MEIVVNKSKGGGKVMKDFGTLVFGYAEMEAYLPENVYQKFLKIKNDEELLDKETADTIAKAMKEWAISKGATHYTHWFQPLTGSTAEKHDAF